MDLSFDAKLHQRALKRMPIVESELNKKLWALVEKVPELEKEICELWDDAISYGGEAEKLQRDYDEKFKPIFDVHGDPYSAAESPSISHRQSLDSPLHGETSPHQIAACPTWPPSPTPQGQEAAATRDHDLSPLLRAYGATQAANEASWPWD